MKKYKNRNINKSIFSIITDEIKLHIINNLNLYIIVSIFFLIGIIAGVLFFNNINDNIQKPINNYIENFINILKSGYEIDYNLLLRQIVINYIIYVFIIWFLGCTMIGIPIVYTIITWKGFSFSYSISSIISCLGIRNGIIFSLSGLFIQNIISIPVILALGVSGNKLYKKIIQDKRKENIKIELIKHTIFCLLMLVFLIISALIETYISSNLIRFFVINFINS